MTVLMEVQGFAQAVADAIAAVAGVEVGMVDENLLTVVGSGKYARHIGRTLEPSSVSARALAQGRTMVIANPPHDDICRQCTQKDKCTDAADIICPIIIEGRPAGCVILVACTAAQKEILLGDMQRWINFLERMADLISRAFNERQQVARAENLARQLDVVFDSVSDGILTLDGSGMIVHANQAAAHLLK
jgi:PAS domain-containing protein